MAPPAQQQCTAPGCTYNTAEGIPTWELILRALEVHQKTTHPFNVGAGGNTVKVDKKTRPAITPQMTEENWRFFNNEWGRYKRQTGISGTQLLDELWECMTEELRQLTFAEGGSDSLQTEDAMIAKIKKLAVISLHPSVHVVTLHDLKQQSDENVQTFAARVKGVAASCGLQKTCTAAACNEVVSFTEETCYHVVLAGLHDLTMKERALTQAMMNTITDLPTLVTWCTADEGGRLGTPNGGTIARLRQTNYRKLQNQQQSGKCDYCGGQKHGDGSRLARSKDCKAFGKTCTKCSKQDHFSSVCRYKKQHNAKQVAAAEEASPEYPLQEHPDNAVHGAMQFSDGTGPLQFYGIEQPL